MTWRIMTALAVCLIVVGLVVTVMADEAEAPQDHGPAVTVDVDRSKPRPALKPTGKVRKP